MRFSITFFSEKTYQTVTDTIEAQTVGQALRQAMALTIGKQARNLKIIQID